MEKNIQSITPLFHLHVLQLNVFIFYYWTLETLYTTQGLVHYTLFLTDRSVAGGRAY